MIQWLIDQFVSTSLKSDLLQHKFNLRFLALVLGQGALIILMCFNRFDKDRVLDRSMHEIEKFVCEPDFVKINEAQKHEVIAKSAETMRAIWEEFDFGVFQMRLDEFQEL